MTCTVLLARHGETDWNRDQRWQGHADPPLNERGRDQAHELADRLAATPLAAIYSSDLRRAHETAAIVAERKGLPLTPLAALREVDVGEWSGLSVDEVEERFPDGLRRWREGVHGWEHGESFEALGERVVGALLEIASAHRGQQVLVITHGAAIRAASARAHGLDYPSHRRAHPAPVDNCGLSTLVIEDGALRRLD